MCEVCLHIIISVQTLIMMCNNKVSKYTCTIKWIENANWHRHTSLALKAYMWKLMTKSLMTHVLFAESLKIKLPHHSNSVFHRHSVQKSCKV